MPAAVSPNSHAQPANDIDNLFNYDAAQDETLRPLGQHSAPQRLNHSYDQEISIPGEDVDEEIKVTKKRQPVAKLDAERILSQQGIPKLRKISKKMRFKGKGHEFSDMSRLLNTYQLWLDELYPRAKFADGLTMIEKLGHNKRLQLMRREWIDEGKTKALVPGINEDMTIADEEAASAAAQAPRDTDRTDFPHEQREAESPSEVAVTVTTGNGRRRNQSREEEPEDDELDALLAEETAAREPVHRKSLFGSGTLPGEDRPSAQEADTFADEEEAMAGMEW